MDQCGQRLDEDNVLIFKNDVMRIEANFEIVPNKTVLIFLLGEFKQKLASR
jgi:hypothetical protein